MPIRSERFRSVTGLCSCGDRPRRDFADVDEFAHGNNPFVCDTDEDGIADGDEVKYGLLGLSVAAKEDNETARRLRNWLPTDIEDLGSDVDMDGVPDWVEYMGGGEPSDEFDVFSGTDGFPSVFVLTVNVEAENFARPLMLECDGAQVCVKRSCALRRYCREGEWHRLRVVGAQGSQVKVSVSYDDPRYSRHLVVTDDPQMMDGNPALPVAAFAGQHTERGLKFCQPTVEIVNERICFHGTEMNPQMKKTLTARIVPEGFFGEFTWWNGKRDDDDHDEEDEAEGTDVNARRDLAGSEVFCSVHFMMDDRLGDAVRTTHKPITECVHKDTAAQQAEWCEIHDREVRCCREKGITDCGMMGVDSTQTQYLSKRKPDGGTSSGDDTNHNATQRGDDYGSPYYVGTKAYHSIPVNNDDDNGNGAEDMAEGACSGVTGEDDQLLVSPLAPGYEECCPCHECHGKVQILGVDRKINLWNDAVKTIPIMNWYYDVHDKVYVEGLEASSYPNDAIFCCVIDSEDPDAKPEILDLDFTIYSLRLIPDLNCDGFVDEDDLSLVPQMKELGLGWVIGAKGSHLFNLRSDVGIQGDVVLKITRTKGNGEIQIDTDWLPNWDGAYKSFVIPSGEKEVTIPVTYRGNACMRSFPFLINVSEQGTEVEIEAVYKGTSTDTTGYECHAKLKAYVPVFQIAGDGNRDGKIDFDNPADTNIVFWVNDDYDAVQIEEHEGNELHQDDILDKIPNRVKNCDDDIIGAVCENEKYDSTRNKLELKQITRTGDVQWTRETVNELYCYRDLEDFDRLHLNLDSKLKSEDLTLKFKFEHGDDHGLSNVPSINLFRAVLPDLFYITGATGDEVHKARLCTAQRTRQMKEKRILTVSCDDWHENNLKECMFERSNSGNKSPLSFLYEGKTVGAGSLKVRICKGEIVLAETSLSMGLHKARNFADVFENEENPLPEANRGEWDKTVGDFHKQVDPDFVDLPMNSEDDNVVVFILGWNVVDDEQKAWSDMVFKRLFWQNFRGRVVSLRWPCLFGFKGSVNDILTKGPHFDMSEHLAWLSAEKAVPVMQGIASRTRHITMIVHSQGNVLAGELLRRLDAETKSKITYLPFQAAISAQYYTHKYDATTSENQGKSECQLNINGSLNSMAGKAGELWNRLKGITNIPDLQGHWSHGYSSEKPYLKDALNGVRTVNFFNHDDYALNIWVMNNTSKPDNLKGIGTRDTSFSCSPVVDDQGNTTYVFKCGKWKRDKLIFYHREQLHPEDVENDRWCVFSFVTPTRFLAFGQLPMDGIVQGRVDLADSMIFKDSHYYHSKQFRSDVADTYEIWRIVRCEINKEEWE